MDNINQQSGDSPRCCHHKGPIKIIITSLFAILILITAIFMIFAAMNEFKKGGYIGLDIATKNTISISGEGKIQAAPDIAIIDLSVISDAQTVAAAQKDNTDKMNKITQAMKILGIEDKDLQTTNYNISPQYQYTSGKSIIIGYEVNQSLEVKIRQLDKINDVLSQAAALGTNQVGSLTFTFDNPENLKAQARDKAIQNARDKANALASQLGVKIVRIISFSENSVQPPIPYYANSATMGIGGGGGATPEIQAGQNEITTDVTIVYEIQ